MPWTRCRTPQITRAPQIARRSQPTHIQYSGLPRTKIDTSSTASAHGITVTIIHSTNSAERRTSSRGSSHRACAVPPRHRLRSSAEAHPTCRPRPCRQVLALMPSRCIRSSAKAARSACTCVPGTCASHCASSASLSERGLAGAHQMRLAAGRGAGLQVAQRVADQRHFVQVDAVALADLLHQPRQRLAAVAVVLGRVRAEEHRVDAAADLREQLVHLARASR